VDQENGALYLGVPQFVLFRVIKLRRVKYGGTNCTSGENRILVRKPEAKVSLWGTVVILESIKVGLKGRYQDVELIDLAQDDHEHPGFRNARNFVTNLWAISF
jgi:hypothetical protein